MLKSKLQYGLMGVRSRNNAELKGWTQRLEEVLVLSDREQVPLVIRPITHNYSNNNSAASGKLAAYESVAAGGSTNHMAAPEWSNQTYLTL